MSQGIPILAGGNARIGLGLMLPEELLRSKADVLDDLPEESWRDVSAAMEWDSGLAAVGMSELFVGPTLADFIEAKGSEDCHYVSRS